MTETALSSMITFLKEFVCITVATSPPSTIHLERISQSDICNSPPFSAQDFIYQTEHARGASAPNYEFSHTEQQIRKHVEGERETRKKQIIKVRGA